MALLSLNDVSIAYGGPLLLDSVTLHIERGQRAALVGRNGTGKSTLLRILTGEEEPDSGTVVRAPGLRVAYLPQEVPDTLTGTVRDVVQSGQRRHVDVEHWEHEDAATQVISRLRIDPDLTFAELSGGMKRRALLARALVCDPDVLLLDEPTNHLDIESIEWLEGFLMRRVQTLLFVTHDRAFLRRVASRIIDLDRGALAGWDCTYDIFLKRKQQLIDDESVEWERRGKLLTKEEAWVSQGIKARRTRNEGRVRALKALRDEFQQRRLGTGTSRIQLNKAEQSGNLVIKAEDASFSYGEGEPIISGLDLRVMRGERVGIIGPNGSGKTTLLRLLCGQLTPTGGTVTLGTRLRITFADQLRAQLDGDKTIAENIADDADMVDVGGRKRHIFSYLQDFLFTPDRARTPVGVLSGGERNRVLIAKLFLEPCNLLIMDEPTNDLDAETLELLEEQLQQNSATLFLVSHDRAFLNNVVTSTLVLEGGGRVGQYAGGYDDWLLQRPKPVASRPAKTVTASAHAKRPRDRKLTYNETRELETIGDRIHTLEQEQEAMIAEQASAEFYKQDPDSIAAARSRSEELAHEIERLIERWAELEELV
jgi:ATP-binding cassette subfamily F protein uup